ncbi:MAG: ATP-binding protein [Promethearchaeota archaeon]
MKRINFPFSAILGQDRMVRALILNVIDPTIGGVLLTGKQGTGKSTAVRSLTDILPDIDAVRDCPFSCDPKEEPENLCDSCKTIVQATKSNVTTDKKPIAFVDLPLGVTEDMVCGSLDLEKVLKEGIKSLHPGLLAKANRGILYIDEINLLQDHIVDILLDAAASGVNIIEREGVSISHPARFILVGSMNPEEGELRPQINDRLGLEVDIIAPFDPGTRAEITRRVIEFSNNPKTFVKSFEKEQKSLKGRIKKAREIVYSIRVPAEIYAFVSKYVAELRIPSQRADITFIRCARANAAFRGSKTVELHDLDAALDLVFEHRIRALRDEMEPQEIKDKIRDIYGKMKESFENLDAYKPNKDQEGPMKASDEPQSEFKQQPYDPDKIKGLPEINDQGILNDKDIQDWLNNPSDGYKVFDLHRIRKFSPNELKPIAELHEKRISDLESLFSRTRKKSDFGGKGRRTRITSSQKGRYIAFKSPLGAPKNIAFDASVKRYLVRNHCTNGNFYKCSAELPIRMDMNDIVEKVFEFKAPLSLHFILDASGSMARYLTQMTDVIRTLHREGYKKKDKTSVIVFKGRNAHILQRPTTNLNRIIAKLPSIEGLSYTPLAEALVKAENMIKAERMKNEDLIPVVVIFSDLGANISRKNPDLMPQSQEDFETISSELKEIAKSFGRKKVRVLIMMPKKGSSIQYLGVNPFAMQEIRDNFKKYAKADVFMFDSYNPKKTLIRLRKIL